MLSDDRVDCITLGIGVIVSGTGTVVSFIESNISWIAAAVSIVAGIYTILAANQARKTKKAEYYHNIERICSCCDDLPKCPLPKNLRPEECPKPKERKVSVC